MTMRQRCRPLHTFGKFWTALPPQNDEKPYPVHGRN